MANTKAQDKIQLLEAYIEQEVNKRKDALRPGEELDMSQLGEELTSMVSKFFGSPKGNLGSADVSPDNSMGDDMGEGEHEPLDEAFWDGIKSMFSQDSTMGQTANQVKSGVQNAANQVKTGVQNAATSVGNAASAAVDQGKQYATGVKNDFQVGNWSGQIGQVKKEKAAVDAKYAGEAQAIKAEFSALNAKRGKLQTAYRKDLAVITGRNQELLAKIAEVKKIPTNQRGWEEQVMSMLAPKTQEPQQAISEDMLNELSPNTLQGAAAGRRDQVMNDPNSFSTSWDGNKTLRPAANDKIDATQRRFNQASDSEHNAFHQDNKVAAGLETKINAIMAQRLQGMGLGQSPMGAVIQGQQYVGTFEPSASNAMDKGAYHRSSAYFELGSIVGSEYHSKIPVSMYADLNNPGVSFLVPQDKVRPMQELATLYMNLITWMKACQNAINQKVNSGGRQVSATLTMDSLPDMNQYLNQSHPEVSKFIQALPQQ